MVAYTKKDLLQQLWDEAIRLGHVPIQADIIRSSKARRTASWQTFYNHFGSYNVALHQAGLSLARNKGFKRSDAELLERLRVEFMKLGHSPSVGNLRQSSRTKNTVHPVTTITRFGGHAKSLRLVGLTPHLETSTEEMLAFLRSEARRLGRAPTVVEVQQACSEGKCRGVSAYRRKFGSYNQALVAAGVQARIGPMLKSERSGN